MNSYKLVSRKTGYIAAAFALLCTFIVPALVSAAQATERSIELSSSSKDMTGVSYKVNFTAPAAAEAFVLDFCSNSPIIGQVCDTPTGFSAATAATATSGFTAAVTDSNTVAVTGAIEASDNVSVELTGITNPSDPGPLYVRILTYSPTVDYTSATVLGANVVDTGGVAVSITDSVGVSGAVLESMTFCISGEAVRKDCDVVGNKAPTIKLGQPVGDSVALQAGAVSTGSIFTQISTNASSGAIVSLRSSAAGCGGLLRAGAPGECDILPALENSIAAGEAKFGVKTTTATNPAGFTGTGTLQPIAASGYGNTDFFLNYVSGDATGITGTYGDPFLDTNGAPVNNKNMQLTFGASVSNDTPAGLYSTDIRLIATGKF